MSNKAKLEEQETDDLKRILGTVSPEQPKVKKVPKPDPVAEVILPFVKKFEELADSVESEIVENRAQIQREIDYLSAQLLGEVGEDEKSRKQMRQCDIEALTRYRQIQSDQTASRVQLMDARSKLLAALRYYMKDDKTPAGRGSKDLRKVIKG